ncbi:MAG: hypothetical protein ACE5RM_04855, partial [Candidatus Nitrosomaritimum aestuariumsis]
MSFNKKPFRKFRPRAKPLTTEQKIKRSQVQCNHSLCVITTNMANNNKRTKFNEASIEEDSGSEYEMENASEGDDEDETGSEMSNIEADDFEAVNDATDFLAHSTPTRR